jgi:hypothetical protein
MININMVGGGFQHDICSSAHNKNKYVIWYKDNSANISIHIDNSILDDIGLNKNKKRYAWIAESSAINEKVINDIKSNLTKVLENYELIFTHDKRLLSLDDKFKFAIPNALPWVKDRRIFNKTKRVSMVASSKVMCEGHKYRHTWISRLKGKVDHYGWGFNTLPSKDYAMNDYMFSIAMENDNYPDIFTEKITDCFATGTIPVFWGTPDIDKRFNMDGIILLTEEFNINTLTAELYFSKNEAMLDNFERTKLLESAEDYIYLNYLK